MEAFSMKLLPLFDWLLWTTIQAALLFCLIMLVKFVLRSRLPIRWHYCLWLLLLIRLAIPWLPESKISIFNLVPRSIQQGRILEFYSKPQSAHGMGFYRYFESKGLAGQQQQENSKTFFISLVRMMPLLWLFGTVVLAVYVGGGNFHLWWLVTRERPLTDQKILDLLEDCKSEMGIRTILGVVMTDKVKSPALFGFLRPRLLLPTGMIETLSLEELRFVFLHELGHLRRRDIYIGWLMSFLQVLHWFNPLVWLAFYRMQTDRELACDALVLTHTHSGESKDYGRTIVNLLERFSRSQRLPSMAGILETKSQLKRRIKMIAKYKKTSRPRWAGAMLLLAALACVVLTNAYVAKADYTFGTVTNLGPPVNTSFNEGIPRISSDGLSLYFTSDRPGGFGERDLWVAKRTSTEEQWEPATNLGPTVNSSDHDWAPSISADGLTLYFCSWKRPGGHGEFDIWQTVRPTVNDEWGTPENLGTPINTSYEDSMPCISADGLEIYFNSNRAGNHDTADLYVSKRATITDMWSESVNISVLNTAYIESEPFLSADGLLLFFDSDRPGGYGDGDLYVSTRQSKDADWSPPLNLGKQINTQYSEVCPCLSFDGRTLYFCDSPWNQIPPGSMGGVDIWQVSILPIVDFNNDGNVNIDDLIILVGFWGQNEPLCDIGPTPVGDGIVDIKDIEVFMGYWEKENMPEVPEEEL